MDIFDTCQKINNLIHSNEEEARGELIKLLDFCESEKRPYNELINHLIRQLGLYPYLDVETSSWQENFIYEAFKVDVGDEHLKTLHKEQSSVLKRLISGDNLAIIAPTSFGKSFIIDAFISIKQPTNIVIIVPTIALTDETRRRLHNKFSNTYKIITTSDVTLAEKNIFIFPQERALHYIDKIQKLDMLVIDEFYKASADFDKQRSTPLIKAILELSKKANQKYFLAPNITDIKNNPLTEGMEIKRINFNTVFLRHHKIYKEIHNAESKKVELLKILDNTNDKTLIYAGTFPEIENISNILDERFNNLNYEKLNNFSQWLCDNYYQDWELAKLVKKGTGIHNGRLHRSLSQIQLKLFGENDGLKNIISTSSIIEGVNTSAKNVIFWGKKNGTYNLKLFGYKNLIGRGGRMFKHFIGEIYLLEKPPKEQKIQLSLEMPKELINESDIPSDIDPTKLNEVIDFHQEMSEKIGQYNYNQLKREKFFEDNDWELIKALVSDMKSKPDEWHGLDFLNNSNIGGWDRFLYKITKLSKMGLYDKLIIFTKISSQSWNKSTPDLVTELLIHDMDINDFFEQEKKVTFGLSNTMNCVNILQKILLPNIAADISPFIAKTSNAFLPKNVYLLEEYGLPRMISKKIQLSGLINLENNDADLHSVIDKFNEITYEKIIQQVENLDNFDEYILKYFFDGIKK